MSVTRKLLQNRHAIWALVIAATVFGVKAYVSLPMQLFPDTAPPLVNVVTAWPGSSALDVADSLSRPLEEEVSTLEGIEDVRSTSQDNLSIVSVEFQYGMDVDLAAVDVQNAISRIRGTLPPGVAEPQVLKFSTNDRPIITLGVSGEDLAAVRKKVEDTIGPAIQRVPGVAAVDVFGGADPAIIVSLDRARLEAQGIPLERVAQALREHDVAAPAGRVRTTSAQALLRVDDRAHDLDDLRGVPIPTADGSRVRLGDLGAVELTALDDDARFAIDGRRSIAIQVFKTTEANTVDTVERVRAAVEGLEQDFPSLRFVEGEESASFTQLSVSSLLDGIWQALFLAAVIVFLFLGRIRRSAVAVVSMPLSYGITFALMEAANVELNMVTLTAIILAVGMVVDASVVVLENVSRRRDLEGLSAEDAAAVGTDEMMLSVLAGAATTLVVLVPLLFLGGFVGPLFGPLALTLIFAFSSSVVVALVLVPVLTLYAGSPQATRLDRIGIAIAAPFTKLMEWTRHGYEALLRGGLRFRWLTMGVALVTLLLSLVGVRKAGMDVLPKMDTGSFFVSLETPSGTSLEATEAIVREVEGVLGKEPSVVRIQSQVGFEAGMRSLGGSGALGPTQGFITVTMTPRTERDDSIWDVEARVRDAIARVPGIRSYTVRELGNTATATTSAPIIVRIAGADAAVLDRLGEEVQRRLADVPSVVEPTRSWRVDQRRTRVRVDALRAGQLGLSHRGVASSMMAGSEGVPAGEYHGEDGTPLPVRVRFAREAAPTERDLLDYPVFTSTVREPVPLRAVADLEPTVGQAVVTRDSLEPTLEVTAFTEGRPLSFITADVEKALEGLDVPHGYTVELTGERDNLKSARTEILGALGVSVVAVYLLLVAQFRSFLHPLIIMLSVPLSLSGVAAGLTLTGKPVSMPVMIALVLLVGTVVNNAIILVDFIRERRASGMSRREALLESVSTRFRPIMMTSLSTIVGMIPLAAEWALGAERFSPLAIAVIGGMTASTLLTLVVIPVAYDLAESARERLSRRRGRAPEPEAAPA